ncbi:MAG: Mur ligase family protein, partial [Bacteroidales bacterium]|nr:Mur ligase family protein [Bacteroidales bacterium]
GRLDATNVIIPELSVITNISLEHTQLLGDTLAKIAFEKAGIIKNNVPVIIGQHSAETMPVFVKQAELKHAPLYTTDNIKITEENRTDSLASRSITILSGNNIIGEHILLPLAGDYQFENVATFVQAVLQLSFNIPNVNQLIVKALENVIDNTHLMGRWQIINNKPLTICDTGHNSGGFHFITQQLNRIDCDHLHIIIGFVNDKDIQAIINLLPKKATYHICKAKIDRALSQNIIQTTMQAGGLTATVSTLSVYETYLQLINDAKDDSVFYIGGSTFIVADFLKEYFNSGASK